MKKTAILLISTSGLKIANTIAKNFSDVEVFSKHNIEDINKIESLQDFIKDNFTKFDNIIFIGAMGICIRTIAPYIKDKHTDPAIINIDSTGKFVVSVLSGHVGGANKSCTEIAHILGAMPVITTQSDNTNLWALDTFYLKYGWYLENKDLNVPITLFVNKKKTAILLDVKDEGTSYLEQTKPDHVSIFYKYEDIDFSKFELFISVSPYIYKENSLPTINYIPKCLSMGIGCRKKCTIDGIAEYIKNKLVEKGISAFAVKDISTIELKKDEPLLQDLKNSFNNCSSNIYTAEQLNQIDVPNPSEKVLEVTNIVSVAEASALFASKNGKLLIEKQKGKITEGNDFTFALALDYKYLRHGHIEIVGAGPGDPDLVSVKGRKFLEMADLILYAGSLVPKELTLCAKPGAKVISSAGLDLEQQFALMKECYDKGQFIVRLHTGDPCIYGAIQEQMAYFDKYDMSYHITPGISSFLAAAAELKSQFTIPQEVQSIILTRGEGRTSMPEKEQLSKLAASQSTMCIFLSASIAKKVQNDLLVHYPEDTPVAVCYKLTWKEQKIFRGKLKDLAQIVKDNNLKLTTMIVVGKAIGNRKGLSRLYAHEFKHLFRK